MDRPIFPCFAGTCDRSVPMPFAPRAGHRPAGTVSPRF